MAAPLAAEPRVDLRVVGIVVGAQMACESEMTSDRGKVGQVSKWMYVKGGMFLRVILRKTAAEEVSQKSKSRSVWTR